MPGSRLPMASRRSPRASSGAFVIDYSRAPRVRRHAAAVLAFALALALAFQLFPLRNGAPSAGEAAPAAAVPQGAVVDRLPAAAADQPAPSLQRDAPVVVVADGARIEVRTRVRTVAGALALANIEVGAGDSVYLGDRLTTPAAELPPSDSGAVAAASADQPLRIEVVRALPDALDDAASAAGLAPQASPPPLAVGDGAGAGVVDASAAWREHPGGMTPEAAILDAAVASAPPLHAITVTVGRREEAMRTHAATVADVLALLEVAPGEFDRVSHSLDSAVYEGMELVVVFVEKVLEEYSEYTAPTTYWRDDHTLAPGEVRIVEGTPGEVRVVEEVTYENGVEVSRIPHSAVIASRPVAGERLYGPVAADGVSPVVVDDYDGPYREKVRVWATWYNATHGEKAPDHPAFGITYSGVVLRHGVCAVDPDYIPLGSRFYVPGYGECLAADTGGLINGWDIDLGFPMDHAPRPWHTGYVNIYLLD